MCAGEVVVGGAGERPGEEVGEDATTKSFLFVLAGSLLSSQFNTQNRCVPLNAGADFA